MASPGTFFLRFFDGDGGAAAPPPAPPRKPAPDLCEYYHRSYIAEN